MADARGPDRDGPARRDQQPTAGTPSSRPAARSSRSAASWPPTRRVATRTRRGGARRRPRAPAAADACRRRPHGARPAAGRPRHVAAGALHRAHPGAGAGGARHRPPVDVRLDPGHHRRPRLRLQARLGAGAVLARVRDRSACWRSTSARSSTTTSPPRWRRTSTASPAAPSNRVAWLRQFYFGGADGDPGPARAGVGLRRHRRPRGQLDPDRRRHRAAGRPLRPVRAARPGRRGVLAARLGARGPGARRADGREGRGAARRAERRPRPRHRTRPAGLPVVAKAGRYGPYVTEVLPDDAPKNAEAAHRVAAVDDVAGHRDDRRRAAAAVAAAGGRRRPRRRRARSPRRTAATGRT